MGRKTIMYRKWIGYTTDDCSCEYCLFYAGKKKPCPLDICCCAVEREEALQREHISHIGAVRRKEGCHAGCEQRAS